MPGVVGRRIKSAYGLGSTWGTAVNVTHQILLEDTEGFDNNPELVMDMSFGQDFVGIGEIGDYQGLTPALKTQYRFEQGPDVFTAAAMGSSANPTVVSSVAANSLVAYSHVITMSPELTKFFTLASNFQNYVQEITSFVVTGFSLSIGDQGRINASFPIAAGQTTYETSTNTSSTINSAVATNPATTGYRAFRRLTRLRMNAQSASALSGSDIVDNAGDWSLEFSRPVSLDNVLNSAYILQPADDGFVTASMRIVYPRMTSTSANSLAYALNNAGVFKADILMTGTYINSTTQRSALWEFPAVQVQSGGYKAVVTGHGQVRPECTFTLQAASAAPSGMAGLTSPMRVTIVNSRSTNLLA